MLVDSFGKMSKNEGKAEKKEKTKSQKHPPTTNGNYGNFMLDPLPLF